MTEVIPFVLVFFSLCFFSFLIYSMFHKTVWSKCKNSVRSPRGHPERLFFSCWNGWCLIWASTSKLSWKNKVNTAGNWHNLQENNVANVTKNLAYVLLENKKKIESSGLLPAIMKLQEFFLKCFLLSKMLALWLVTTHMLSKATVFAYGISLQHLGHYRPYSRTGLVDYLLCYKATWPTLSHPSYFFHGKLSVNLVACVIHRA